MSAFAMYRLPHAKTYTRITQFDGAPRELHSYSGLSDMSGFCIAPFAISSDCPIVVISPDRVEEVDIHPSSLNTHPSSLKLLTGKERVGSLRHDYAATFSRFHEALMQGRFRKLVLARCADEEMAGTVKAEELFLCACHLYPRMFVALVSTETSGTWLAATPEILLDGRGNEWHTVALAGTMRLEDNQLSFDTPEGKGDNVEITWSTKNIQEQHYVATYIKERLLHFTSDISEEGPATVRAGHLVHLRSDFKFGLPDDANIGELIECLHPTPAVCGLPKDEAYRFILDNEKQPRRYYSGFMGPLDIAGDTHLYVSLRCMQIKGGECNLYAGGGILKDSVEEQEWNETEAKLETMRKCIATKRM